MWASANGNQDVVCTLLEKGADMEAKDNDVRTFVAITTMMMVLIMHIITTAMASIDFNYTYH